MQLLPVYSIRLRAQWYEGARRVAQSDHSHAQPALTISKVVPLLCTASMWLTRLSELQRCFATRKLDAWYYTLLALQ